jgi:hypothetical protein
MDSSLEMKDCRFIDKNAFRITSDKIIETSKGYYVMGVELLLSVPNSKDTARKPAAFYGWQIGGKLELCKSCGIAKAE